tara:strand:+ start:643 stop:1278 length:636 start_codon:yes stop_codon:yes gene_type:complete
MTRNSEERDYYQHLLGIMLATRGVRFAVAESERKKEKFSIATISILSVYLAGWSLAASLFPDVLTALQIRALSLVSVVASVSLLLISLFDFAAGRSVYAEKMLQNAFSITEIMRATERELAKDAPDFDLLSKLASEYEARVSGVGVNHTSRDYKLWLLQRRKSDRFFQSVSIVIATSILRSLSFISAMFFQIALLVIIFMSTAGIIFLMKV